MAFDQNQLIVSSDGKMVGWNASGASGGTPSFWTDNSAGGMWAVLNKAGVSLT